METLRTIALKLTDAEIVAKFQAVCGVERLPCVADQNDDTGEEGDQIVDSNGHYNKYVKHRHKYVLQPVQDKLIASSDRRENGLQKEGVPPFTSDDSDSDNCPPQGQGRYKITPHRINYYFIYYAFKIASFLGHEDFYLTFLPFCVWNFDSYVIRHTIYVWCIAMFMGQVSKDIFQWARPATPPVVRLETDFAQEFAMPSTHAVAGSAIPFVMAFTIVNRYQINTSLVVAIAIVWCLMVCCSRLYLGVHSVLDLLAGCAYSLVAMAFVLPYVDSIDWFIQTHPVSPILLFLACLGLSTVFYPAPDVGNNTHGDCVQVIASVTGCLMGFWGSYFNGMSYVVENEGLYTISQPTLKFFATAVLRFMIGGITLVLVKTVVKTISIKGASYCLGLSKPDRRNRKVMLWYKFVTYMTLGVIITWTVPILHAKFGLGRPGFYAEVV